jgi:hypothetical protein
MRIPKNKLKIGLAMVVVGIVAIWLWPGKDDEPSYEGKRLSQWVLELRFGYPDEPQDDGKAQVAVRQIGTNAIPYLLEWVFYKSPFEDRLNQFGGWLPAPLRFNVGSSKQKRSFGAILAFQAIGEKAKPALPILIHCLTDSPDQTSVLRAKATLVYIQGPAAIELARRMADQSTAQREKLAGILAFMSWENVDPNQVAPFLQACATDTNRVVAETAAACLDKTNSMTQRKALGRTRRFSSESRNTVVE